MNLIAAQCRGLDHETQRDEPAAPAAFEKPLSGVRILVAEDSPDNQVLLLQYLSIAGASVEIAENGQVAVEKANQKEFDIILMDVMMPVCDGYEATRELRDKGYSKPILALTANALRGEKAKSLELGCDDHLNKPVNRKLLIQTIENLVRTRSGR